MGERLSQGNVAIALLANSARDRRRIVCADFSRSLSSRGSFQSRRLLDGSVSGRPRLARRSGVRVRSGRRGVRRRGHRACDVRRTARVGIDARALDFRRASRRGRRDVRALAHDSPSLRKSVPIRWRWPSPPTSRQPTGSRRPRRSQTRRSPWRERQATRLPVSGRWTRRASSFRKPSERRSRSVCCASCFPLPSRPRPSPSIRENGKKQHETRHFRLCAQRRPLADGRGVVHAPCRFRERPARFRRAPSPDRAFIPRFSRR